ncbi:MAG: hypothetical protein H0Z29_09330 [Candidatus Marinimicrobia bacterium]|nr:hypothetical protein [Candidatus Neomarinimicrobiota bacterium]
MKRLFFWVLILFIPSVFASQIPVDISDPVYVFLKRMEAKGIIETFDDGVLPLSRDEIAIYLKESFDNSQMLNEKEKEMLLELMADYRYELKNAYHPDLNKETNYFIPVYQHGGFSKFLKGSFSRKKYQEEGHLFIYETDTSFIWFDFGLISRNQWKNGNFRTILGGYGILRAGFFRYIDAYLNFGAFNKLINKNYTDLEPEEKGAYETTDPEGKIGHFDNLKSSLIIYGKNLKVGLFYHSPVWGVSKSNSILLSGNVPELPYIFFQFKYKKLKLSYMHGSLLNDSTVYRTASIETRSRSKYFVGHRIDIFIPVLKTNIGLNDFIVYGDRNIDLGYLNPVSFFRAVEHHLQDRDNALLSFDIKISAFKNEIFYFSFLLDELSFYYMMRDWWANKFAIQAGIFKIFYIYKIPVNLNLEYTAVHPWTYSHKTITTNYTNAGYCLGFPYGPNSQVIFSMIEILPGPRSQVYLDFTRVLHGEDTEERYYGGDPRINYELRDKELDYKTKWLMGSLKRTNILNISYNYEIFNQKILYFKYSLVNSKFKGEINIDHYFSFGFILDF